MTSPVSYQLADSIATITIDDGKVNALSPMLLAEINAALDRAVDDGAVVVLSGRDGILSAGFDLKVLRAGGPDVVAMLRAGFELSARLLSFPTPVVIACPGHAMAMGVFLLLSGDYRIGVAGDYKICANEVAIGMTMPHAAVEMLRQRLTPAAFTRATLLSEAFSPESAVAAGLLDLVVTADELVATARGMATQFAQLNMPAHAASKLRAREHTLTALRAAIEADMTELGE
jgi:enoyl-CoA hydratase